MGSCLFEQRNRRILLYSLVSCGVMLLTAGILSFLAVQESNDNYRTYNRTVLIATEYITQPMDCYGLPWRAFIIAEYDAVDRNCTIRHYKQTFRRIGDNEICGTDKKDALRNASIVWPLADHKESYYMIDDPTVLISIVTHGELYIVFAVLFASIAVFITIFATLYLWARTKRYTRYTQLQFSEQIINE